MFKYLFAKADEIPAGSAAIYFGYSSIIWFVIGTGLGSFNAAKLAFPDFVTGSEILSFGHRVRLTVPYTKMVVKNFSISLKILFSI